MILKNKKIIKKLGYFLVLIILGSLIFFFVKKIKLDKK
jgi:hypothetical protein